MYYRKFGIFLYVVLYLLIPSLASSQVIDTSFSFTLLNKARTSAGIYKTDSTLVRTLWSGVNYDAGKYKIKWDGTDDTGAIMPTGNYIAKVLSNNVQYNWEGIIGNTSDSLLGITKYHANDIINAMAISGNTAYCGIGYNEGNTSELKFSLSSPQQKVFILPQVHSTSQRTIYTATDGVNVYWAGYDPFAGAKHFVFATKTSDDLERIFPSGQALQMTYGRNYQSVINYINNGPAAISGLAVQKNGSFLFVSHKNMNEIHVLNKTTGAQVQTITTFTAPKALAVDTSGNLWVTHGASSVDKYSVDAAGQITSLGISLSGLVNPLALAVSPDNLTVVVADAGSSQQLKAFSNSTGASSWTFGILGGYVNDPNVNNNKFYFSDSTGAIKNTYIAFAPDGSFWVGDPGNYRSQHYAADRTFIERIMYFGINYSVNVDPNNQTRVFSEYLEFAVDYSLPLAPSNGSWTLVKNWRGPLPLKYYNNLIELLENVVTLSNGRTYGTIRNQLIERIEVVELPPAGPLRFTGILLSNQFQQQIYPDGSLRTAPEFNAFGRTMIWKKQVLTGFDASHNPLWGAATTLASVGPPHTAKTDPVHGGAHTLAGEITSSNVIVSFSGNQPIYGSSGYHLGGIKVGGNKWLWRTSLSTHKRYNGPFPNNGDFDIGNDVGYAGNVAMAMERSIIWGYNGEFWKASQTNKWNHVYDNGLFVGQFGITGPEVVNQEGPPMMSGNTFSPSMAKVGSDYYLYLNDESYHSGVHRWKITGLNSIQEQSIPIDTSFQRTSELPVLPGVDLMAGLPFDSLLVNNTNGWTRFPEVDAPGWRTATNKKTYGKRKTPDLWVRYAQTTGVYTVNRDVGTNTNLNTWKLSGKVAYENNMPNTSNMLMYLEVLDNTGKVLVRFYNTVNFNTQPWTTSIYANNTLIASGGYGDIRAITDTFKLLEISKTGGSITVKYADFAPVSTAIYDAAGVIGNPKSMRLYFNNTGGALYDKLISLDEMRFITTEGSSYFRSAASGNWNDLSTWQSSVDNTTWVGATAIPSSSAHSISVLNGHTIKVTDTATVDELLINDGGTIKIIPNSTLIINDGASDDIIIAPSGNLIIQSDSSGTGRIGNSSGNVSGNVTVERYINSVNNKSYRLLSPSVNSFNGPKPFIRDTWQEGQNNTSININSNTIAHHGIHITGSMTGANGFDATQTGSPSMFTYDQTSVTPDWIPQANTNATNLAAKTGYLVYIPGDRSTELNNNVTSSNTTLRALGSITTGTQTFTNQEGNGRISLVANPYPCPVNWSRIYYDSSTNNAQNFEKFYTYWDSNIGISGGFATVSVNGIKSAATNSTVEFQSGQAFFIRARAGIISPTFTIKESHKSAISNPDTFPTVSGDKFLTALYFSDIDGNRIMADAVNTVFDNTFSTTVDGNDAEEMANREENIAIIRDGKMLSIEERPLIDVTDTLPLIIQRLRAQNYEWQFNPTGLTHRNSQSYLDDKFLNIRTPISLTTVTIIPFSVSTNLASAAQDRFQIIFAPNVVLPVTINVIKAYQREHGIKVDWTTVHESNIRIYEVERSSDGQQFVKVGAISAKAIGSLSNNYSWVDKNPKEGNNYYRIKTIDLSGAIKNSQIVNVEFNSGKGNFEVYPNPVTGDYSIVQFNNISKGVYIVELISSSGQIIFRKAIFHPGGSASQIIPIEADSPAGIYNVQIKGNDIFFNKQIFK